MTEGVAKRKLGPWHRFFLWFFVFVCLMGGCAFVFKLWEFFLDLTDEDGLQFAGSHLMTYCLVAGGFLLLLTHSLMRGHFSDIEKPKYDLLASEERYDREEFGAGGAR